MKTSPLLKRISRIMIWLSVGILVLSALGATYQAVSTKSDQRNYPALGQLVDVGGYKLHIYCLGETVEGSPTVILEQGLGGTSAAWARVQPEIAKSTRVCAYD
ncbi:MAG TPA: hypothetical protein PLR65_15670, partial [Anaerolineales bacterium]|nr:hypothetical protein [Anaerolineales bacterium]